MFKFVKQALLVVATSFFVCSGIFADVDFSISPPVYKSTLTRLEGLSQSTINGLLPNTNFSSVATNSTTYGDFTYSAYTISGNTYSLSQSGWRPGTFSSSNLNPSRNGSQLARIGSTSIGQNITGYFYDNNYTGGNRGGAVYASTSIGNITGDFLNNRINYSLDSNGGAIYNGNYMQNIKGDFVGNSAISSTSYNAMGGAIANGSSIENIQGTFLKNYVTGMNFYGGAIHNNANITTINADFIANYGYILANNRSGYGGAIANTGGIIDSITGNFIGNQLYTGYQENSLYGGAIYNGNTGGLIKNINANFNGNATVMTNNYQYGYGGAIYNQGTINTLNGDFINNSINKTKSSGYCRGCYGGAVYNSGTIGLMNVNAVGNYVYGTSRQTEGGMLYNTGTVDNIVGNFYGNYVALNNYGSWGGAILNIGLLKNVEGVFVGNYSNNGGGAVINGSGYSSYYAGNITKLSGVFINNYVKDDSYNQDFGGAVYNINGSIADLSGIFRDNYVQNIYSSSYQRQAFGGAIYNNQGTIKITADGVDTEFTGNYISVPGTKFYNAIGVGASEGITLNPTNNGQIILNDSIEFAAPYGGNIGPLKIISDGTGVVQMNDAILGRGSVYVTNATLKFGEYNHGDSSFLNNISRGAFLPNYNAFSGGKYAASTALSLDNGTFDINNGYFETVMLTSFSGKNNSTIIMDVDTATGETDYLSISGNVTGKTNVIFKDVGPGADLTGKTPIVFASAKKGAEDAFNVYAVYGSPYMYDTIYKTHEKTVTWAIGVAEEPECSDCGKEKPKPPVRPEVMAYSGLHIASIEQIRSVLNNVRANTDEGNTRFSAWVAPLYENSNSKNAVNVKSNIYGGEFGFDIRSTNNSLSGGVFGSVRHGSHSLDGRGKDQMYSPVESKIGMNSYLAGGYVRTQEKGIWVGLSGFGGIASADIDTADAMSASDKASVMGFGINTGAKLALIRDFAITPVLSAEYRNVNWGNIYDDIGKTAKFNNLNQFELEGGVKLSKDFSIAQIYIKPTLARTLGQGYLVNISGLDAATFDDMTIGRIEVGTFVSLSQRFSGNLRLQYGQSFSSAGYTHIGIITGVKMLW
jgi:hypothetical protein